MTIFFFNFNPLDEYFYTPIIGLKLQSSKISHFFDFEKKIIFRQFKIHEIGILTHYFVRIFGTSEYWKNWYTNFFDVGEQNMIFKLKKFSDYQKIIFFEFIEKLVSFQNFPPL